MSDGFVQHSPDSSGKKIDTSELTVNSNTVERQRVVIASDSTDVGLVPVKNSQPVSTDYALVTRVVHPDQNSDGTTVSGPVSQAVVNDTVEQYSVNTVQTLSITTEGRLRVSSVQANVYLEMFDDPDGMGGDNPSSNPLAFKYNTSDNPWGI